MEKREPRSSHPTMHTRPVHRPTSEGGGSSQAASHVHRRHRIPDPILVCRVVQTLHGAEAGAAVITANHVDPVVKGHRGHIASLPSNALGFRGKRRLCHFSRASLRPHLCGPSWVSPRLAASPVAVRPSEQRFVCCLPAGSKSLAQCCSY